MLDDDYKLLPSKGLNTLECITTHVDPRQVYSPQNEEGANMGYNFFLHPALIQFHDQRRPLYEMTTNLSGYMSLI
jgi:hypothetical protein